jgi:hypothetical protein
MARKKKEEETKKKKPGRPPKKEKESKKVSEQVEEVPEAPKKKKPGRPPGTGKPIGRVPKPKKKTKALKEPEVVEEKETADGIGFGDLLSIADDLNDCLEPDPLIDADDEADEDELRKAILDTAELLTDDDIIAAKVFPKGTPTQNRMDSDGGGPYLAIETLELLQKMGVELPEPLAKVHRGGKKAAGKKREAKRAELRERAKAEVRAKLAEEAEDEDDNDEEEETLKKGKKKRYTRVDSLVDAIKMGPCTKKELAERANILYMEHGGTDSLVHAKWYVTGIAQVIKELGVDVYTTKK